MKKRAQGFVIGALLTSLLMLTLPVLANQIAEMRQVFFGVNVSLDGQAVQFDEDSQPFVMDGRTFLPVRTMAEILGFDVEWNGDAFTAILTSPPQAAGRSGAAHPDITFQDMMDANSLPAILERYSSMRGEITSFFPNEPDEESFSQTVTVVSRPEGITAYFEYDDAHMTVTSTQIYWWWEGGYFMEFPLEGEYIEDEFLRFVTDVFLFDMVDGVEMVSQSVSGGIRTVTERFRYEYARESGLYHFEVTGDLYTVFRLDLETGLILTANLYNEDGDLMGEYRLFYGEDDDKQTPGYVSEMRNATERRTVTYIFNPGTDYEEIHVFNPPLGVGMRLSINQEHSLYMDAEFTIPHEAPEDGELPDEITLFVRLQPQAAPADLANDEVIRLNRLPAIFERYSSVRAEGVFFNPDEPDEEPLTAVQTVVNRPDGTTAYFDYGHAHITITNSRIYEWWIEFGGFMIFALEGAYVADMYLNFITRGFVLADIEGAEIVSQSVSDGIRTITSRFPYEYARDVGYHFTVTGDLITVSELDLETGLLQTSRMYTENGDLVMEQIVFYGQDDDKPEPDYVLEMRNATERRALHFIFNPGTPYEKTQTLTPPVGVSGDISINQEHSLYLDAEFTIPFEAHEDDELPDEFTFFVRLH